MTHVTRTHAVEERWPASPGLLESVWQYWWLVALVTVVAAGIGLGASLAQPTLYEGEARLLLSPPGTFEGLRDASPVTDASRYVRNRAQYVTSAPVRARVVEQFDDLTVEEFDERIDAAPSPDIDLITIRARHPTPQGAAELANAVAEAYKAQVTEELEAAAKDATGQLEERMAQLRGRLADARTRLDADPDDAAAQADREAAAEQLQAMQARTDLIGVEAALFGSGVELTENAEPPLAPVQPRPVRNTIVATVLGLLAAAALAWWLAERTQGADDPHDAAPILRTPLLGQIPDFQAAGLQDDVPAATAPHSPAAEAYQFVLSSLKSALEERGASTVLVTSAAPGDGKTVSALNLAAVAVSSTGGRRVLLVDADERMRGLTRLSDAPSAPGMSDLSDDEVRVDGCIYYWWLSNSVCLPFVAAGSDLSDPAGFFRGPGFQKGLIRLRERADFMVVDAPPLLAVSDTSAIASQVDGILLVVTRGTRLSTLEETRARLDLVGAPLLGYVFNRASTRSGSYAYRGHYDDSANGHGGARRGRLTRLRSRG